MCSPQPRLHFTPPGGATNTVANIYVSGITWYSATGDIRLRTSQSSLIPKHPRAPTGEHTARFCYNLCPRVAQSRTLFVQCLPEAQVGADSEALISASCFRAKLGRRSQLRCLRTA